MKKEVAPAVLRNTPRPGPQGRSPMDHRIIREGARDETLRTVLREALNRYRNELLPDEERMQLQDRIKRLQRRLQLR